MIFKFSVHLSEFSLASFIRELMSCYLVLLPWAFSCHTCKSSALCYTEFSHDNFFSIIICITQVIRQYIYIWDAKLLIWWLYKCLYIYIYGMWLGFLSTDWKQILCVFELENEKESKRSCFITQNCPLYTYLLFHLKLKR